MDTGKGPKASRMAEWPVVAEKESNVERRGHAESDSFDRKVRQGRRDKTFRSTAGTEAKDIP